MNQEDEQERRISELEQNFSRLQALQSFSVSDKLPSESDSLKWDNELGVWTPGKSGGALGFTQFDYRWDLPPDSTPGPGHVSRDGDPTDPSTATTLYLSKWDSSGDDFSVWFSYMKEGDWLNIYDRTDSDVMEQYDITGPPIVNGDVFEVPVVLHAEVGSLFVKNQRVSVFWRVVGDTTEPAETVAIPQYFVGSIYKSIDPTDPGLLFGGTWVPHAEGRMLVGVDPLDPDFATPGLEGGHKLMQAHTHGDNFDPSTGLIQSGSSVGSRDDDKSSQTSSTGGGDSENMPPYTTVYVWVCTVAPVTPPTVAPIAFHVSSDVAQTTSGLTVINFPLVDYDFGNGWDGVSIYTVPAKGIYGLGARVHKGATPDQRLYSEIRKSVGGGAFESIGRLSDLYAPAGGFTGGYLEINLDIGDRIQFHASMSNESIDPTPANAYMYGHLIGEYETT